MLIGIRKYKLVKSPLIVIFYRDGLSYFLVLSGEFPLFLSMFQRLNSDITRLFPAVAAANIIVDLVGPPEYRFLIVMYGLLSPLTIRSYFLILSTNTECNVACIQSSPAA